MGVYLLKIIIYVMQEVIKKINSLEYKTLG